MSRASNTLTTSDVLTTPIKLKYSSSYDSSSYYGAGIRVLSGVNGPVTSTGSVIQTTLNYRSVRHLYYSNYLTGSFPVSASYAINWEQSTAASGTLDADIRNLPTGSGEKIKILSIPREVFGEKISRGTFQLVSNDDYSFNIVDDGNGNLVDLASDELYVSASYFNPRESLTRGYVQGSPRNAHVGNLLYAQGIIIITNPDYYNVLDAGPTLYKQVYNYYDTAVAKQFNPLLNALPDSSPIDTGSLKLIPIPNQVFPSYTIASSTVTLTPSDPLFTTIGSYTIDYSVTSSIGTPSNVANIQVNIIPDCTFTYTVLDYYSLGSPLILFDFYDKLVYANSGSLVRDLSSNNNNGVFTIGVGNGTPTTITTYREISPRNMNLPGGFIPAQELAIKLPNSFKFSGTQPFTFVAWVNLLNLGAAGLGGKPGIVAAEGRSGINPIGWAWYYDSTVGLTAARYDGAGGGDAVTLAWTNAGYSSGIPYNTYVYMCVIYDGLDLSLGVRTLSGYYTNTTTNVTATSITANSNYGCFMGLRYNQYPKAKFGYLAGYNTALSALDINAIYIATKAKFGY